MGPGIPCNNPPHWDGSGPRPYLVQGGILPDWGTGSLYNSSVAMQDTPVVYPDWRSAAHTSRPDTFGNVLGDVAAVALGYGFTSGE